LGVIQSEFHR